MLTRLRWWLVEWGLRGIVAGRCNAFGGVMPDGRVRTCDKPRWHTDSHTYEFLTEPV